MVTFSNQFLGDHTMDDEDPNDPFYILPFLRRKHEPKSEEPMLMSYHKRQVFAAAAEAGAEEAPAKPPRKAASKPAAKAAKGGKAAKPAKAAAPAKAKGKGKPAKRAARTVDPSKLDAYGFRKGTLKSKAAAMYAAKKGATLAEVKAALDSTQFNLLTQLEEQGYVIERKQEDGDGGRKITRYKLGAKK